MKLRTLLRLKAVFARKRMPHIYDLHGFARTIADASITVCGWAVESISDRPAPIKSSIKTGIDTFYPNQNAHQATHIAGVAVRIPTTGIYDFQRLGKITVTMEQRVNDQTVVRHHVAITAILVVTVVSGKQFSCAAPIFLNLMPRPQICNHPRNDRILWDIGKANIDKLLDIVFNKGHGFHGGQHLRAIDGFPVVTYSGCSLGKSYGLIWISWRHHGPTIDKDLSANLLSHHLTVHGH